MSPKLTECVFICLQEAAKRNKSKESPAPISAKATFTHSPHYKLNMRPSARFKPMSLRSPARHLDKSKLFESLEDSQMTTDSGGIMGGARETFVPRRSIKKLTIKPKVSEMSKHLQYLASYNLKMLSFTLNLLMSCSDMIILTCSSHSLNLIRPHPLTWRSHLLCHTLSQVSVQSPLLGAVMYPQPTDLRLKSHPQEELHPLLLGQRTRA